MWPLSSHRREMMALNVGGLQVCIFSCGSDFVCLCDICVGLRRCNRRHVCLPIGHALVGMGILLATSPLRCAHGPRVPYELNARLCACVSNSRGRKAHIPPFPCFLILPHAFYCFLVPSVALCCVLLLSDAFCCPLLFYSAFCDL